MITADLVVTIVVIGVSLFVLLRGCLSDRSSTREYINNQLAQARGGVEVLQMHSADLSLNSVEISGLADDQLQWLRAHCIGKISASGFVASVSNGKFLLLHWPSLLASPIPSSTAQSIPTILTMLGVFGTFIGISVGLANLGVGDITESSAMLEGARTLIAGMQTAFWTSVAGMGFALWMMWTIRSNTRKKLSARNKIEAELRHVAVLETANHLLLRLDRGESDIQYDLLKDVADRLSGFSDFSAESIGRHVAAAISPGFKDIRNDLIIQRETIEIQRLEITKELIKELRTEVVDPVADRLDQSVSITRDASLAVKQLKDELGGLSSSLAGSVQTINTFQQDTLGKLQSFAFDLKGILEDFRTETKGVLTEVAKEVTATIDATLRTQTETLRLTGDEAAMTMKRARDDLSSTLTNIGDNLQSTRVMVEEELTNFRSTYMESLDAFFVAQNASLTKLLDQQRSGLAEAADQLRQVFTDDSQYMRDNIAHSMSSIKDTTESVSNLANSCGLASSERLMQLQEIARTMGDESGRVETVYKTLVKQMHASMNDGNKTLSEYLERANDVYSRSLRDADESIGAILRGLDGYSHNLVAVAEQLVCAAEEVRDSVAK